MHILNDLLEYQIIFILTAFLSLVANCFEDDSRRRVYGYESDQYRLVRDKLVNYDNKVKPTYNTEKPITVNFSMDLYQLLELNEPQQYVRLNAWIIERWYDEFLFWIPELYNNITEIRLPHEVIWLPDTTLWNSLVMKDEDQRRLLNAKLVTRLDLNATYIEMLYPAIFKFSCLLNLRYFPYDVQRCRMIFGSWTYDKAGIDYFPHDNMEAIGNTNFIENEAWGLLKTSIIRVERNFPCCPINYTLLHFDLFLRRKPLFYLVNLIIPTSIITLIALVGFFTSSSASGMREEKISLGITTLLSMSILMLMVGDQMPTTSTFIPLIGWFILGMIVIIASGTLASTLVIAVHKKGRMGIRLSLHAQRITKFFSYISLTEIPIHLRITNQDESGQNLEVYRNSVKLSNKLTTGERKKLKLKKLFISKRNENIQRQPQPQFKVSNVTSQHSIRQTIGNNGFQRPNELPILVPPSVSFNSPLNTLVTTPNTEEDRINSPDDENTSKMVKFPAKRNVTNHTQAQLAQGITAFTANLKKTRKYAETEYEWLATVLEHCFFVLFVTVFIIIAFGINVLGYYKWKIAETEVYENPNCKTEFLSVQR